MLKITPNEIDGGATRLTLEGRLVGPWVGELDRVSHDVLNECGELVLDLRDVQFVDRDGIALLNDLRRKGAALQGCSAFVAVQLKGAQS